MVSDATSSPTSPPGLAKGSWLALNQPFDSFPEVMAVADSYGASDEHTILRFDANNYIKLLNVAIGSLVESDFHFG